MQPLIIGIKGTVLALDRATGQELWRTPLKGADFVNVTLAGEQVLATTRGEIYCLDKAGTILWHNPLKGQGQGLVTIATEPGPTQAAVCAEKLNQDAAVAAGEQSRAQPGRARPESGTAWACAECRFGQFYGDDPQVLKITDG